MTEIKRLVAMDVINRTLLACFWSSHRLENVCEMFGCSRYKSKESYKTLRGLNCLDYKDMDSRLIYEIPNLIADVLEDHVSIVFAPNDGRLSSINPRHIVQVNPPIKTQGTPLKRKFFWS